MLTLGCAINAFALADAFCAGSANLTKVDSKLQLLYQHASQNMAEASLAGVHSQIAAVSSDDKHLIPARFDSSNRVLVHIYLDGTAPLSQVSSAVTALTGKVLGSNASYRHGVLAAYLPTDQIANGSMIPGVRCLTTEPPPKSHVGTYTSQGASELGTDVLNSSGLSGDGITVGVLSDSFNTSDSATTAQEDVATGDLPVVNVLEDFPGGTDEGRAMCQIVYDEAPHTNLAFATAFVSEVDFANNISLLRTSAGCNVIVDDVSYFDEPVFSDGMVAQSVNSVATSTTLSGSPVVYCSSAGNDGNNGYRGTYKNLPDSYVREAGHHGNLILNVKNPNSPNYLDPSLTKGGWYNWSKTGGNEPSTIVSAPGPTYYEYAIFMQWDDLFDQDHGVTTSFNFLVFDANGNYLSELSSTTNAFTTQQPYQGIGYLNLGTNYQIAITKTTQTDPLAGPVPSNYHLALYTTLDGASTLTGEYFYPAPLNVPNLYGHAAADGAIAVAAYVFNWRATLPYAPELENFSSPGPVTVYFDANNNRLSTPIVRQKPEVSGVDGVLTTFFGSPYYNAPYAFFGTSAAAPSVAGVAALMVQAAGGPGSIAPTAVKSALEASGQTQNSTVEQTSATVSTPGGKLTATALGQTYFGTNYMTISNTGTKAVSQITIDGTAAGLVFDTTEFELGTLNGIPSSSISVVSPSSSTSKFTIQFLRGAFKSGTSFQFTVGQDFGGSYPGYTQNEYGVGVDAEDLSFGATLAAQFVATSAPVTVPFVEGKQVTGFNPADGFGLVSAVTAVNSIQK